MKKNIGITDKIIRIILALVAVALFFTDVITGTAGILVLAFAGIMLATAFVNFCGLYVPFGISTCKRKTQ